MSCMYCGYDDMPRISSRYMDRSGTRPVSMLRMPEVVRPSFSDVIPNILSRNLDGAALEKVPGRIVSSRGRGPIHRSPVITADARPVKGVNPVGGA